MPLIYGKTSIDFAEDLKPFFEKGAFFTHKCRFNKNSASRNSASENGPIIC